MKLKERIIIAMDVGDKESAKELLDRLYPMIKIFKVGSQLFTSAGQEVITMIKRKGADCFLDLKFHDIPATVGKASASATSLGVDMFNIHASGGLDMMKEAVNASKEAAERLKVKRPLILGVTVLTSMGKDDLNNLGIKREPKEEVLLLAGLAKKAGLDGVIASPDEIKPIKKKLGKNFLVITPGIRPSWAKKKDQKRVATPRAAFDKGADYIVIGRPITEVEDPRAATERVIGELE